MSNTIKLAGIDIAMRVDNTNLTALELKNGVLEEIGSKMWPHIDYALIGADLLKIQRHEKFRTIGFDRMGSGEVVRLFPREIPFSPIVSTANSKFDMISLVKSLFQSKKLVIHNDELYKEIMEQEIYKSDAGNLLYRHPSGHHDDRFWSLCYACEVARPFVMGYAKIEVAVAKAKPRNIDDEMDKLLSIA